MQRKPPYCIATQDTQDGSSQQNLRTHCINNLQNVHIVDVWTQNFHEEMQKISSLTKKYNVIAIDTQFPSIQEYNQKPEYSQKFYNEKYTKLAKNVDNTCLIQLGLCIADQEGSLPLQRFCWQFNFKFQGNIEQISPSSAYLLKKAGIKFQKLLQNGINYKTFTHQFIKSGLLLNKRNKWVVFHGGFDFSYMLKLIKNQPLPKSIQEYYKSIKIYFPAKIDIKQLLHRDKYFKKFGLSKLADAILCRRIGPQHQAGSDSLLTLQCYFRLKQQFQYLFTNLNQIENIIYGIGSTQSQKFEINTLKQQHNHIPQFPIYSDFSFNGYFYYTYQYCYNNVNLSEMPPYKLSFENYDGPFDPQFHKKFNNKDQL